MKILTTYRSIANVVPHLALTLLLQSALVACGSTDSGAGSASASGSAASSKASPGSSASAKPTLGGTASAPTMALPPKTSDLIEKKNDKAHYSIKVPADAVPSKMDESGGIFTSQEMTIEVAKLIAVNTPDDLLRAVNTSKSQVEKRGGDQPTAIVSLDGVVWVYSAPKGSVFVASCTSTDKDKELAIAVCTSLKLDKK